MSAPEVIPIEGGRPFRGEPGEPGERSSRAPQARHGSSASAGAFLPGPRNETRAETPARTGTDFEPEPEPDLGTEDRATEADLGPELGTDVDTETETDFGTGTDFGTEFGPAVSVLTSSFGQLLAAVERRLDAVADLAERRLSGERGDDEFGFDREFVESVTLPLLRPLYRSWFRVEVRGIENLPVEGGALVVSNHAGTIPLDALMLQVAVHDEHPAHRFLRMLAADLVFETPMLGEWARRSGATSARSAVAERLLTSGEVVGVWPEGFRGIGKPFRERYKLQRFGRGGFVATALRTRVPIVPCSVIGSEEIYPIVGDLPGIARRLGLPYLPITPTWPLLGVLGLVPLPSKWLIEFGAPVDLSEHPESAADDPHLVFELSDRVRRTIQETLYELLLRRRAMFS